MKVEKENATTANMQYVNVLFCKGEFLDYNDNLADNGGSYSVETMRDK